MQVKKGLSDGELVERLTDGDDKAFDLLFYKYLHKLHLFAAEQTGDPELSREIVMDVMLRLWQRRKDLHEIRSLNSYLFSSVKNAIIDNFRKKALQINRIDELQQEPISDEQADTRTVSRELQKALQDGLEQLSPQRRLVFELRKEQELSHQEIALRLNISPKTVENHLAAAVSSLKAHLEKHTDLAIPVTVLMFTI